METGRKPLITVLGSSGLVGTAVTRELAQRPVRLRLVGRRRTTLPSTLRAEVDVRSTDLAVPGSVADAIDGADVIIHLVAHISEASTWRVSSDDPIAERVNLGLVHDLIGAVEQRGPSDRSAPPVVLLAGSMSQAGKITKARTDGSEPDQPLTTYDRQKLDAEHALLAATEKGLIRGSALRLATLYSQGTDSTALDRGVVSAMMRRAFAGQPLTMWHDGSVNRDLVCVDDAARAFVAALDQSERSTCRAWLVGTGEAVSIARLFTSIAEVVAEHTGLEPVPVISVPPASHSMPTDNLDFVVDPTAFQHATGWAPRVSLLAGLKNLAAAIARENGHGRPDGPACES